MSIKRYANCKFTVASYVFAFSGLKNDIRSEQNVKEKVNKWSMLQPWIHKVATTNAMFVLFCQAALVALFSQIALIQSNQLEMGTTFLQHIRIKNLQLLQSFFSKYRRT